MSEDEATSKLLEAAKATKMWGISEVWDGEVFVRIEWKYEANIRNGFRRDKQ